MPYVYEFKVCPHCGYASRKKRFGCNTCPTVAYMLELTKSDKPRKKKERLDKTEPYMKREYALQKHREGIKLAYDYNDAIQIPNIPELPEFYDSFKFDDDDF